MNYFIFSHSLRKGVQVIVLIAMLLFSFGPGGASTAYAAAPPNDTFANALNISSIPFQHIISTTEATETDLNDPDAVPCEGRTLARGKRTVWYRYQATTNRGLHVDTIGSDYDTYIAVWRGTNLNNLTFVVCNDDVFSTLQSEVLFAATAGNTYYIEVAGYAGTTNNPGQNQPGGNLQFHVTSFQDVPSDYWAWGFIEGIYGARITSGCNTTPLLYCPTTTVTRDQMAVFLLRAKHGASYSPPPVGASTGFADVPTTYWAAAWIKQLAAEGITGGCSASNYCPTSPVTRDQMAVFLLRAKYGAGYSPPPVGASTGFTDVPTTYWAAAWIKRLAAEGITGGCSASAYCPLAAVSRDQMAVFLSRTFGITPLPGG
ncbi:MAG TPA: S-layer homology domain-containing protein [Anaerolineales bacterium]|nr:S-layer homology domain-containing protein [Anaerolineales bacterium]